MSKLTVISMGAGVQSTTLALMAAHGELTPMPDCAIFADTGWEPKIVYDHLAWLMSPNVLPFPVHVIKRGNIRADLTSRESGNFPSVPFFMVDPHGNQSMATQQCTMQYKIRPIRHKLRELLGARPHQKLPKGSVEFWIGISIDEAMRMKPSGRGWQVHRWPLLERRMSRNDCLRWIERHGYPTPPKSSCIGCPFNGDRRWRELRNNPKEWADAVAVDASLRDSKTQRFASQQGKQFMHRSLKPLDQVDLSTAEDHGQLNLFNNECSGICGV
jgi:hypothetical protein